MKAIELNMPDEVYQKLEDLASRDHRSVNAFASRNLAGQNLVKLVEGILSQSSPIRIGRNEVLNSTAAFLADVQKVSLSAACGVRERHNSSTHCTRWAP